MKNNNVYHVNLINDDYCVFDSESFTNLKKAKKWAAGRGGKYRTEIFVNDDHLPSISYKNR